MRHIDPELLAGHALGQESLLTPDDLAHLTGCSHCQAIVESLRRVAETLRSQGSAAVELFPPEGQLWDRIITELHPEGSEAGTGHEQQPADMARPAPGVRDRVAAPPRSSRATDLTQARPGSGQAALLRGHRRWRVALAAAVAGVLVGIGGTVVTSRLAQPNPPSVQVVASVTLHALPGKTGSGHAELVRTAGTTLLRVQIEAPPVHDGYYELWLLNSDGQRMQSLGVLPPDGHGAYPLPGPLAAGLGNYRTIDVSIQPLNGSPAHSHNSLVRGQLPI